MLRRFLPLVGLFLIYSGSVGAQGPEGDPRKITLSDIGNRVPWHHIGAPPDAGSPTPRLKEWPVERADFNMAPALTEQSWTGEAPGTPGELRSKVWKYEDLLRAVTDSGGYGNLILGDTARRLSVALMARYIVAHPSDYAVVDDILRADRVRLLDCAAFAEMLESELKLAPPSGRWHLSENWDELTLVVATDGSTVHNLSRGMPSIRPGPSELATRRQITVLLSRIIYEEGLERATFAGLIEFLKRGGSLSDLHSFDRIMGKDRGQFRYVPFGKDAVLNVDAIAAFQKIFGAEKGIPFSQLVGKD
jgi:hypothetical protein